MTQLVVGNRGIGSGRKPYVDEAKLIARCRDGSEAAVRELFRRYWPLAWQWAYAVVGERSLADQAAQEGIVAAFGALSEFDLRRPFAPWLRRIVVNRAIDELRQERRRRRVPPFGEITQSGDEDPELVDVVVEGVSMLPAAQRTVVVLHYWLDMGVDEIATLVGIPIGTVLSRLGRARAALRERLESKWNLISNGS